MVAFVQRLPSLSRAEYTALAFGAEKEGARSAIELARFGPFESEIAACARCHGLDGQGFADGAFPKIGGQSEAYLLASLEAYARGERPSGIMQPATAPLSADERRRLASYYAGASRMTTTSIAAADPRLLALGQRLVQSGAPERGIPACAPCHGPGTPQRNPLFPELVGQHARAIEDQLALWRKGLRQETPLARIMAPIGQRLSEEDARAVALYYATAASSPPAHTGVESGAPQR